MFYSYLFILILVIAVGTFFWQIFVIFKRITRLLSPDYAVLVDSNISSIAPTLKLIIDKYAPNTEDCNLVELGCGRAVVTDNLASNYKFKQVIAVDSEAEIITLAKAKSKNSDIQFLTQDIFNYKAPEGSIIYCYLFARLMNRLYREGRLNGSLVISLTFAISGVEPTEILAASQDKNYKFTQKEIFVYDFRDSKKNIK